MTLYTNASTAESTNSNTSAPTTASSINPTTSTNNIRDTSENICQANIQSVYSVPKAIEKQHQALDKSKPTPFCMTNSSHTSLILNLRVLIKNAISQHHLKSASFYADKLVSLSSDPEDVVIFADTCYLNREYHRAIHFLKDESLGLIIQNGHTIATTVRTKPSQQQQLTRLQLRAHLLLARSMLAIKQREECLDLLGKIVPDEEKAILSLAKHFESIQDQELCNTSPSKELDDSSSYQIEINPIATLCLLMGESFEAVGNRENACFFYMMALKCDLACTEAFFHLFEKQMLSFSREKQLLEALEAIANTSTSTSNRHCHRHQKNKMGFLLPLYQSHLGKYQFTSTTRNETFQTLEQVHGLEENLDVNITKAESYYYQNDIEKAHHLCESLRTRDPYNFRIIPLYVATLVELNKKRELYHYAHQMVDIYPKKAAAWYTVGCYYLLVHKYEAAQRYFHKATTLEPVFAPAWIGFGNAFAAQDESDQSMSSYRTASSLFPGCHLPPLFMGMEHLRTNNLALALEFMYQASRICPHDPLVYNELGAVYYKQKQFPQAIEMFTKALELCQHVPEKLMEVWEPTYFNLGYAYRKLKNYDQAVYYFQQALRLSPRNASIHSALGFTYHMQGNLEQAIESYHTALAYNSEETLAGEMITVAFDESLTCGGDLNFIQSEQPKDNTVLTAGGERGASGNNNVPVQRILTLDASFSSIDPPSSHNHSMSIDFSEDSSMNLDDEV